MFFSSPLVHGVCNQLLWSPLQLLTLQISYWGTIITSAVVHVTSFDLYVSFSTICTVILLKYILMILHSHLWSNISAMTVVESEYKILCERESDAKYFMVIRYLGYTPSLCLLFSTYL